MILQTISDNFADLTTTFQSHALASRERHALSQVQAPPTTRKTEAMRRIQLETDLSDDDILRFIDLFQTDVDSADAYLILERPGLRKRWIESKLRQLEVTSYTCT